jgi:aspartyl-tRNA synthetase
MIFFSANDFEKAVSILSVVRLALRDKYNIADNNKLSLCWITDFPMFSENEIT